MGRVHGTSTPRSVFRGGKDLKEGLGRTREKRSGVPVQIQVRKVPRN